LDANPDAASTVRDAVLSDDELIAYVLDEIADAQTPMVGP
jgi:hypothetical protein